MWGVRAWEAASSSEEGPGPSQPRFAAPASSSDVPLPIAASSSQPVESSLAPLPRHGRDDANFHDVDCIPSTIDFGQLPLMDVGTDIIQSVARAASRNCRDHIAYKQLLDKCFDKDQDWSVPGRKVMGAIIGSKTHSHVQEQLQLLAAVTHYGAC